MTDDERDYAELMMAVYESMYIKTPSLERRGLADGLGALHRLFDRWLRQAERQAELEKRGR